jgi:prepilin peptidase CpaA
MFLSAPQWVCVFIVAACTTTDLLYRRIPNWITIPAVIVALIYNGLANGWVAGIQSSLAGLTLGCALLIPPFAMGGMGGGDVKLLGALGAWMGGLNVLNIFLFSAWAGALGAVVIMVKNNTLVSTIKKLWGAMACFQVTGRISPPRLSGETLPYALAIAAGYS